MVVLLSLICQHCKIPFNEPSLWRRGGACGHCGKLQDEAEVNLGCVLANSLSPDDALRQVWCQLAGHTWSGHSTVNTLNRLIAEDFEKRCIQTPPTFTKEAVEAMLVWWPTYEVSSLAPGHERETSKALDNKPALIDLPVVVLRLDALDCVIDGSTRINRRLKDSVPEPHPVYLISRRT